MKQKNLTQLAGVALFAGLCLAPHQLYANAAYAGGDGTESNPYLISTPEELNQIQIDVNVDELDTRGVYYLLVNDIDLSGFDSDDNPDNGNWTPMGMGREAFILEETLMGTDLKFKT